MKPERILATVLFTDIVGSTERATELRDEGWGELRRKHDALVRRELRRFGGREVKTMGDGFLAVFPRPAQALACAASIRDAVRKLGLDIRAGLHMGEVEETRTDVAGVVVHVAARVAAAAGPAEILVSSTLHDTLGGSSFEFEDRGIHLLKGVPGEWRLFSVTGVPHTAVVPLGGQLRNFASARAVSLVALGVVLAIGLVLAAIRLKGGGADGGDVARRSGEIGADPGIAVLPFSVSGAGLQMWREGMVDVLSTNLDGAAWLRAVDSRTVMARWRERVSGLEPPDLATALDVARRTGAHYALLGSVVSSGPGMRLAADVYDLRSGTKLGQGEVEGSPDSIFSLVDRLSIEVMRPILGRDGSELPHIKLATVTTSSVDALKAFLEGEALYRRADFRRARGAYAQAIRADSAFALAHYRLGLVCGWSSEAGCSEKDVTQSSARAHQFVERLPEREALLVRGELAFERGEAQAQEFFQQAVERYPDDAEAWYHLGEVFFHMGGQLLAEYEDTERALTKALELDSLFAPAYLHLIGDAFMYHADSGRAARLIQDYERVTSDTERDVMHRVSLGLAFGDAHARARAEAELDSLSTSVLWTILTDYLMRSRFWGASEIVLQELAGHLEAAQGANFVLFWNDLARGRVRAAFGLLDEPVLGGWRERGVYYAHSHSYPLPAGILERHLAPALADSLAPVAFYGGAYAADRARWSEHSAMLARLRERASELEAEADSSTARLLRGAGTALEGYGLWKQGRREQALKLLKAGQREGTSFFEMGINAQIRWWLGNLLLEMGRPQEAERYFRSLTGGIPAQPRGFGGGFWQEPLAAYHLGKVYEEVGEIERARRSYQFFIEGWQDADPELQPKVQEARAAIQRLSSAIRE